MNDLFDWWTQLSPLSSYFFDLRLFGAWKRQNISPKWWFNGDESHDRIRKELPTKKVQV